MHDIKLPVPPALISRAIQIASNPDCTVTDLSDVVKASPVLSAQLLKAVNSAYYALRRKISVIDRAISFMGVRAVRNILLCFGVRELAPTTTDYPLDLFWESSLRRAISAVVLAKQLGIKDVDNILTLGLCQDLGVLVIVTQKPELTPALKAVAKLSAQERLDAEIENGVSHIDVASTLFEQWAFPDDIIEAVRFHHEPKNASEENRIQSMISCGAEAISDLMLVEDKRVPLEQASRILEDMGIGSEKLSEILTEVSENVTKAAEMFSIEVGEQPTYEQIMKAASDGLFALNMSYEALTAELQESLRQQEKMAKRLEELNAELERQAMTDKLTGLPNRRSFDESLKRELSRASRINAPCSLIIIDIDHFKKFNDVYGHQVGDMVLEVVGRAISETSRNCDLPARYGGEEFAVILPHTPLLGAVVAAERLRKAIAKAKIDNDGESLNVTASLGVTVIPEPSANRAGTMAIRRADDALYEAKASGRNCVKSIE